MTDEQAEFPSGWTGERETLLRVERALRDVWDPELALDVLSLGLVYGVRAQEGRVEVEMTLTTPGCPVADSLPVEAERALREHLPGTDVEVMVVWDPPWTPGRMSVEAREELGL